MSHATSELSETRNARMKGDGDSAKARAPRPGDRITYREWSLEDREYVPRFGYITAVNVSDRIGTPTTISATIFTPATASGSKSIERATQGDGIEQWEFA